MRASWNSPTFPGRPGRARFDTETSNNRCKVIALRYISTPSLGVRPLATAALAASPMTSLKAPAALASAQDASPSTVGFRPLARTSFCRREMTKLAASLRTRRTCLSAFVPFVSDSGEPRLPRFWGIGRGTGPGGLSLTPTSTESPAHLLAACPSSPPRSA